MTTKREQILAYVAAQLQTLVAVPSANVYRSRQDALRREEGISIVIEPVNDTSAYTMIDFLNWSLQFRVAVIVRGDIPDQIADPVVAELFGKLMADRNLGGLVFDILPQGTYFSMVEGDQSIGIIETIFTVTYRTSAGNLS